jgi:hypothetical protein
MVELEQESLQEMQYLLHLDADYFRVYFCWLKAADWLYWCLLRYKTAYRNFSLKKQISF